MKVVTEQRCTSVPTVLRLFPRFYGSEPPISTNTIFMGIILKILTVFRKTLEKLRNLL